MCSCSAQARKRTRASWITARTPGHRPGESAQKSATRRRYLDPYNVAYAVCIPLNPSSRQMNLELVPRSPAPSTIAGGQWLDKEPRLRASLALRTKIHSRPWPRSIAWATTNASWQVSSQAAAGANGPPQVLPITKRLPSTAPYHVARVALWEQSLAQATPPFYLEDTSGRAQAMQANIVSLVAEGVFEHFPSLKLVLSKTIRVDSVVDVAHGFAWSLLKSEVRIFGARRRSTSASVSIHTQPVEEPHQPQQFSSCRHFGDMVDHHLCERLSALDSDDPDFAVPNFMPDDVSKRSTPTTAANCTVSNASCVRYLVGRRMRFRWKSQECARCRRSIGGLQRGRRVFRDPQSLSTSGAPLCEGKLWGVLSAIHRAASIRKPQGDSQCIGRLGFNIRTGQSWCDPQRLRVRTRCERRRGRKLPEQVRWHRLTS